MLMLPPSVKIFLSREPGDIRKGHDGLAALVQGVLGQDLFSGHLFVFLSKRRDRVKILSWDRGGLVL
jgi:transposase